MKSTYEESRRQRHQMQKVFDQIRKNHSGAKGSANTEEEDTNMEDEDEEDDTEDDLALEKRKEERDLEESNRRYEDMLHQLHSNTEPKIKSIRADIMSAENYRGTFGEKSLIIFEGAITPCQRRSLRPP